MQLTPSVTNEIAFGDTWGAITSKITGAITNPAFLSAIDESGFPFTDPYHRVPGIGISGVQGIGIPVSPYFERNIDKSIYDNVSITHGSHTIRTGMNFQAMRKTENAVNGTNGSFSFASEYGNPAFANFLLGYGSGFSQASRDIIPDLHFPNIEAYVQDDWKIRHNFTVNLGLRYAFFASPEDDAQILDNFSPVAYNPANAPAIDPVTGNFVAGQAANPGNYSNGIIVAQNACNPNAYFEPPVSPYGPTCSPYGLRVNPTYNTFAPRIGFAWDIFGDGKTALRGGFGVHHDRTLNGIEEKTRSRIRPSWDRPTLVRLLRLISSTILQRAVCDPALARWLACDGNARVSGTLHSAVERVHSARDHAQYPGRDRVCGKQREEPDRNI